MSNKIPKELTPQQQLNVFRNRNIYFKLNENDVACKEIQSIGYYKLKSFAYVFSNWHHGDIRGLLNKKKLTDKEFRKLKKLLNNHNLQYSHLSFSRLLDRYTQDKRIRMNFLSLVESVEVSLDSNVADILGKYGAFGYLNFYNWANFKLPKSESLLREQKRNYKIFGYKKSTKVNENEYKRFCRENIMSEQEHLKQSIHNSLNRHTKLKNVINCLSTNNLYYCIDNLHGYLSGKYPSVWLMSNIISFGEIQHIIWLMMPQDQHTLSKRYRCSPAELISWIGCLHNIRNICAHNENFIDISLKRLPKHLRLFNKFIINRNRNMVLSTPLFIMRYLSFSIPHGKSNFTNIVGSLKEMVKDNITARSFGFINRYAINILSESKSRVQEYYH